MAVLNLNVPDTQFESNVQMKSKSFGIGDVSAIIDILRNRMYSHPIRTLVQEYICNARDAMIEAGTLNKHKLSITAPTKLACEFRVRDFGVGLSEERVQNVFTMYGASTKRNTNGQIGGYGLGAKSAWAYTDSFTVVSFFNGTKTTYLCHVGRDNIGSMDILSQEVTQELNGVEIIVTVKPADVELFQQAVKRCITFWDRGIVKTNIEVATVQQLFKKEFEEDNIIVFNSNSNEYINQDVFVVDGIQFVSPTSINAYSGLYIFLKTGEVDIAPSRESIIDNDKFKQVLASIKAKIKSYQSKIDSTTDTATKIELALKYKPLLGLRDIKINNDFSIVNNGSHFKINNTELIRRYSNKNGGVVYDKLNDNNNNWRHQSFLLGKDTYVIIADDSVSQVRRRLEYYFSTVHNSPRSKLKYNLTSHVVCLKDKSQMEKFLLDKLTVIEASSLPVPAKVTKASNAKPKDSVRVIQYYTYSNTLYSGVINENDMSTTDAIKVPFSNFSSNQKLTQIARANKDLNIYALTKDDFKNSSLPTLEEYVELKAKEERKKIGFALPNVWQKIAKQFPKLITHDKWGETPADIYLTEAEIVEHRTQVKKLATEIDNLLAKFPLAVLISNNEEKYLSEVITYITLKEAV